MERLANAGYPLVHSGFRRRQPQTAGHSAERVWVNGKFFARGTQRMHVQGVTYGPFAPNEEGEQFPSIRRVADDFSLMQVCGINAVRSYHVPPEWFLQQADR